MMGVRKIELRESLLNNLEPRFKKENFKLNKKLCEFTRKTKEGWHKFQIIFLDYEDHWELKIGLLIRKNIIEDLFHKVSYFDTPYHKSTATLGIELEDLVGYGKSYRFILRSINDLDVIGEAIIDIFNKIAINFFKDYDSLEAIDRALNMIEGQSVFSGYKYGGNMGIIAAKLVQNPNYDILVDKYRGFYEHNYDGFYLKEYNDIVEMLDKEH